MKKLSIILIFFFICLHSFATHYFVSATGNDANNGTSTSTPFKTIAKVNTLSLVGDDIVSFNGGDTFIGTLNITHSGTSGHPITYNSYGTGNAIISGFTTVSSWTNLGSNIWESTSAISTLSTCNIVVINGMNTGMGRFPNSGYLTYQSFSGSTSIASSSLNSSVINWTGAEIVLRTTPWLLQRQPITTQSGSTITYPGLEVGRTNYGFFIQNDSRTLDVQNEWYYNPTTKKIRVYSIVIPTNVQVATIDELVLNNAANYITYDGINFTGSNTYLFETRNSQHVIIQNCNFRFAGRTAIMSNNAVSANGILTINNNTISDNNESAIKILSFTDNFTVTNNIINNTGMIAGAGSTTDQQNTADAIDVSGTGSTIQNNIISNTGHIGIAIRQKSGITAQNNFITNWGQVRYDVGAIYSWNPDTLSITSRTIDGNICINNQPTIEGISTSDPIECGIYLDGQSKNTTITNNTVSGCISEGIHILGSSFVTVTDNTVYNNGNLATYALPNGSALGFLHFSGGSTINNLTVKDNIFFAKNANQFCSFYRNDDGIFTYGYADSNYYARPILDNLTFRNTISFTNTDRNLASYQTYTGQDLNSKKSPASISNVNQLFFAYNPNSYDSTVSIPAGTWVDVTGTSFATSTVLHAYSSIVLIYTGSATPPTANAGVDQSITWPTNSVTLSGSGTAGSGSIVAYGWAKVSGGIATITNSSSASTTVTGLDVGIYQFQLTVTNTSGATATDIVQITVNKGTVISITYTVTSVTFNNSPQQIGVVTNPAGLATSTLYNNIGQIPTDAGVYATITNVTDLIHWNSSPISGFFTINLEPGSFTVSNTTVQYDSLLHTVSVSTSNPLITYTISGAPQRYKNSYLVTVHNTNTNFNVPDAVVTLTITAGAAPPPSWSPANMTYGQTVGSSQTNATDTKPGVYSYTPATGFAPSAGSFQMSLTFTPSDTNLAPITGITRTINVVKRTDIITVTDTTQYADGTSKTIHPTTLYGGTLTITGGIGTAPGDYPFTISYSDPNNQATPISGTLHILSNAANIYMTNYQNLTYNTLPQSPNVVCIYPYTLSYSPSNHTDVNDSIRVIAQISDGIHVGSDTVWMSIIKATPTGTWAAIPNQTYIYTVQSGILNASVSVAGTGIYNVNVGDTLIPGTYNLTYNFTPTNSADYNSIVLNNSIVVSKGSATISINNNSKQYNGLVQYATVTTNPPNLDSLIVTYAGAHTDAGSYPISAQLISNLYTATTVNGTLTISQGSYTLSWATPTAIQQGTALNYALPSSSIAGTFTYNYPIGYIAQNNLTLVATFHPTDLVNYPIQTISVFQSVYGNPLKNYYIKHGKTIYLNQ